MLSQHCKWQNTLWSAFSHTLPLPFACKWILIKIDTCSLLVLIGCSVISLVFLSLEFPIFKTSILFVVPGPIPAKSVKGTPFEDKIFLNWKEPVDPNGIITQYEVIIRHLTSLGWGWGGTSRGVADSGCLCSLSSYSVVCCFHLLNAWISVVVIYSKFVFIVHMTVHPCQVP